MTTIEATGLYGQTRRHRRGEKSDEHAFSMRGRVIWGMMLAIILLFGIGGWSVFATLSGAIIGSGTVLVDQDLKVIQHIDGGVVREIAVRAGDKVVAGQLLLRLDDVQIQSEQAIIIGQLGELVARQVRLVAERDDSDSLILPSGFYTDFPDATTIATGERQLFAGNKANNDSRRDQLTLQVAQLREEINGLNFQKSAIDAELALVVEERRRMGILADKKLTETSRVTSLDRDIARMQGQQGEIQASAASAQSRVSETELQILTLRQTTRNDAQRELREVEAKIAELRERLAAVKDRYARAEIRSPVDGTINELNVSTLGGVITPAERLMTIVPKDAALKIEFKVAIKDIDEIAVGQPTKLRFSAFNRRTTPEIDGIVTRVTAAAQRDAQTGESYYIAQVAVTGDISELGSHGLIPGMPVEVFVQTSQQSAIAYLAKPFMDEVTRAFRED
jgi:HlyD family secretion protein